MLDRQCEGIAEAKNEGKYKGRPASIDAVEKALDRDDGSGRHRQTARHRPQHCLSVARSDRCPSQHWLELCRLSVNGGLIPAGRRCLVCMNNKSRIA
jgi:hypothetical protein